MTKLNISKRKHFLLWQMLPHTWIGHPVASLLSFLGCDKAADNFHYWTLPHRAKRRIKQSDVPWICDSRLRLWDMAIVPIYSLFDAMGMHEIAAAVCYVGPHEVCVELGACISVYFNETTICKNCGIRLINSSGGWVSKETHSSLCSKTPNGWGRHIPKM